MKQGSVNPKLMVALGALVLLAGWFMLIRPQGARLVEARDERAATEAQLQLARQKVSATPTTVANEGPTPVDLAVPADPELPGILRQLEGIARETGLRHTTVTPAPLSAVPGVPGGSLQITIGATGSRAGSYAYLNRLAAMPRLVVVEEFGFGAAGQGAASPVGGTASAAPTNGEVNVQILARVFTTEAPASTATS